MSRKAKTESIYAKTKGVGVDTNTVDFAGYRVSITVEDRLAKSIVAHLRGNWTFPADCLSEKNAPYSTIRMLVPRNPCNLE